MAKSLQQLIDEELGTPTGQSGREPTVSVTTGVTVLLPADPNRIGVTLVNLGSFAVFITPVGQPSTSQGMVLGPNGGSISLHYREDYHLVGREWRAIASGGTSTVYREEVISI